MKNKIIKYLFIVAIFFAAQNVLAFNVNIKANNNTAVGSEFYVDVFVNTDDVSINGVEGNILYDSNLASIIRIETGESFISNWIEFPKSNGDIIHFAGITPNGFTSFINLNTGQKSDGKIARFVFKAVKGGTFNINTKNIFVTYNDGEGTIKPVTDYNYQINIGKDGNIEKYTQGDSISPTIIAYIIVDANLYNGEKTLVFNAIDKESGIENVYLKQKNGDWKIITSPYLLDNGDKKGIITLRAVDFSGNEKIIRVFPDVKNTIIYKYINYLALIALLLILVVFIKRYVVKKK